MVRERTCRLVDFAIPAYHNMKIFLKVLRRCQRTKKAMGYEVIPVIIGALGTILKRVGKGTGRVWNRKTSRDHPKYSIVKISQNTEKSPGNFRITCCHSDSSERQEEKNFLSSGFCCFSRLQSKNERKITLNTWKQVNSQSYLWPLEQSPRDRKRGWMDSKSEQV